MEPEQFPAAVAAGAAMVEIGNYDAFYPKGIGSSVPIGSGAHPPHPRACCPDVVMSVTVPHILPMDQQEQLAVELVAYRRRSDPNRIGTSANFQRRQPWPD